MQPYASRPITFHGIAAENGWRLKRYSITYDHRSLDWTEFEPGVALAITALPTPAVAAERPGVGFLIAHRGRGVDYIVLGWWDRENELPARVFVREHFADARWRPARASESFCVWDLQVINFERDAYVSTVLGDGLPEPAEAYLARHLERPQINTD